MLTRLAGQRTPMPAGAKHLAAVLVVVVVFIAASSVSARWEPGSGTSLLPSSTPSQSQPPLNAAQPPAAPPASNFAPFPTPTPIDPSQRAVIVLDDAGRRWSQQTLTVNAYYWMLLTWSSNSLQCQIYIAHDGQPTPDEIEFACGEKVYKQWLATPGCSSDNPKSCKGLYLHYAGRQTEEVTQLVELPKASVEITTPDCQPYLPCAHRPSLLFTASEPLPDHRITGLHYRIDGVEYACPGTYCQATMPLTGEQGVVVEVWAGSTLGDTSPLQRMRVRTYQLATPDLPYQFDLLGEPWQELAPSCSLDWDRFPPTNPSAHIWLEQPPSYEYLATSNRYALLAGELIWAGQVDASECADNGLLPNRAASPCGETAAVDQVLAMQNQFDPAIFTAGLNYNIPPRLLKGVFGQESQFWPHSDVPEEYGLARLTDHGLDMLLTWNLPYFLASCREVLSDPSCISGYDNLSDAEKAMLRGAAFAQIGTPQETALVAQTLKASCAQVTQLGENILGDPPGAYFSYQDLWALSLASYHSGTGCVADALEAAYEEREELSWPVVAAYLEGVCQSAVLYVDRVFYLAR